MMKKYTMTNGEVVTYKELQAVAKDFSIKANQKADVLIQLIGEATKPVAVVSNDVPVDVEAEFHALQNDEGDDEEMTTNTQQSASEASAPVQDSEPKASVPTKLFTFVRADNCIVHFKQKDVDVKIGWSKKDFKCYIVKDGVAKFYSPQTAINKFKQYVDGKHGDIKRIVHALVRIKTMPSVIKAMADNKAVQRHENVSRDMNKENQTTTSRRPSKYQVIDPQWLARYKEDQGESFDAREVRSAYESYLAQ